MISNNKIKSTLENYMFVLPAVLMFFIFSLYPYSKVFQLSAYEWDGISKSMNFVGLTNFKDIVFNDPNWWKAMWHAAYITLLALTFQNFLALILALACDRDIKGGNVYGTIFYIPPVLSGIVVGLIWNWIYNGDYGLLNYWLGKIGLAHLARAWLADPKTALTCVAVTHMWQGFGWGFIVLLSGLQNIPRQLYEAARVDGATSWQVFVKITVPLMIPVFVLVAILTVLGTMQIFALIISMTNGGPGYHTEVPVTRLLASMIGSSRFGYACAQGIVFGVALLIVSLIQIKLSKYVRQE